MTSASVIVVDNDAFTRATLATALEGRGLEILGAFLDARSCLAALPALPVSPDVAVLDLDLGAGPTGIDLAHALRLHRPRIGLVMLTHYRDPRLLAIPHPRRPPGLRYLTKSDVIDISVLIGAILSAHASPLRSPRGETGPDEALAGLTATQIEVLRAVAQGYSTQEIARQRSVSGKAVEKVITRICEQLELPRVSTHNQRVQLVRAFVRMAGQGDALPSPGNVMGESR